MNGLIYKAISPSGKFYIGQSVELQQRKINHKSSAHNKNCKDYDHYFHKAIRKYGFENIKWEVLIENLQTQKELNMWERLWIFIEKSNDPKVGYNMTEGGENPPNQKGKERSEEHKASISAAQKGRKRTEEQRKNHSLKMKGRPSNRKGKKMSQEQKDKISKANKNKKKSPRSKEHREKISKMMKERWKNKELMIQYLKNGRVA